MNPNCSTHNFVKYWLIFKILSLLQCPENLANYTREYFSMTLKTLLCLTLPEYRDYEKVSTEEFESAVWCMATVWGRVSKVRDIGINIGKCYSQYGTDKWDI